MSLHFFSALSDKKAFFLKALSLRAAAMYVCMYMLLSGGFLSETKQVVRHLYGATSSPPSTTSISHIPASNGTDGGDDDGHRGGNGGGGFRSDSGDASPIPFFADRLVTPQEGEDRDCVRSINSNNDEILLFLAMDDDLGIL